MRRTTFTLLLLLNVLATACATGSADWGWHIVRLGHDTDAVQTGWQGYDFVVNYRSPRGTKAFVQQSYQNKWIWRDCGEASIKVSGNRLMLRIPRELLGMQDRALDFEFKWSDNMQDEGNIMDFYVNGDAAPGGRFNYVFSETAP